MKPTAILIVLIVASLSLPAQNPYGIFGRKLDTDPSLVGLNNFVLTNKDTSHSIQKLVIDQKSKSLSWLGKNGDTINTYRLPSEVKLRWLSVDPMHQHFSPYLGMGNNPISFVDPDGAFDSRSEAKEFRQANGLDGYKIRYDSDLGSYYLTNGSGTQFAYGSYTVGHIENINVYGIELSLIGQTLGGINEFGGSKFGIFVSENFDFLFFRAVQTDDDKFKGAGTPLGFDLGFNLNVGKVSSIRDLAAKSAYDDLDWGAVGTIGFNIGKSELDDGAGTYKTVSLSPPLPGIGLGIGSLRNIRTHTKPVLLYAPE